MAVIAHANELCGDAKPSRRLSDAALDDMSDAEPAPDRGELSATTSLAERLSRQNPLGTVGVKVAQ